MGEFRLVYEYAIISCNGRVETWDSFRAGSLANRYCQGLGLIGEAVGRC
jgi:hypothetical protein